MKKLVLGALLLLNFKCVLSQTFFGLQNSNYAGVHSLYTNPASLANMPFKRYANFSSIGFNINNNYLRFETPFTFGELITNKVDQKYRNSDGNIDWQSSWIKESQSGQNMWANIELEYRGPSFATRYGENLVWATSTRTRNFVNISNVDPEIVGWAKSLLDSGSTYQILDAIDHTFDFKANSLQEVSASLSYCFVNTRDMRFSMGTTGKLLLGLGSFNIHNNGAKLQAFGHDSIRLNSSDIKVTYTNFDFLSQILKGVIFGSMPNLNKISGFGYGLDVGFAIEVGENDVLQNKKKKLHTKNYKWKIAGAVLDLGHISYPSKTTGYSITTSTPVTLNMQDPAFLQAVTNGSSGVFNYVTEFAKQKGVYKSIEEDAVIDLPTTIQLQTDFQIVKYINVAAHWQQRLASVQQNIILGNSSLVVVPRIETKWFEISTPISIYENYSQFGFGAFVRVGPVYIGTDNMLKSLNAKSHTGMNMYFGISSVLP
jgi:hypothetical protein